MPQNIDNELIGSFLLPIYLI